jgi:glycosyltransferase involved in cell wall biosynthesis
MRIALASTNARLVGGAESYLDVVIPLLHQAGNQTALICEYDAPTHRPRITIDQASPLWLVSESDMAPALEALKQWRPDVIFSQCIRTVALEEQMQAIAPVINFVHTYYGLCISESKMFSFPHPLTCNRPLGKLCLAHFFPHRCGGLSPLTMLRDYRVQTARLNALRSSRAIVTASEHMRSEILRHGFPPDMVRAVGLPVLDSTATYPLKPIDYSGGSLSENGDDVNLPYRVLFIGRMEKPKGASLLIDAMALAAAKLNRRLTLTLAGDGRERAALENQVHGVSAHNPSVEVAFTGWLNREQLCSLIDRSDLLAVPSLWPEPFGLVGVEAGLRGLPAVAFDIGGIASWLEDGVNGRLVRGRPQTALAFAFVLADCLSDAENHVRLRRGARNLALHHSPQTHIDQLLTVLHAATSL